MTDSKGLWSTGLPNPWVWITGASSGIGRALAVEGAGRGARLVLSARNAARLTETVGDCLAAGAPEAHGVRLDLSDSAALPAAVDKVRNLTGGALELLINNAGQGQRGVALETEPDVLLGLFETNFFGPVELTRRVVPWMVARGRGRVAAVTSVLAKFGAPRRSGYAASKHALHGWFDSLREELLGTGVGVTLLVPGWVRTEISRRAAEADGAAHGTTDAGQAGGLPPEECARRMWKALSEGREEQLIGGWECLAVYGRRFCPGLMRYFLRRHGIG